MANLRSVIRGSCPGKDEGGQKCRLLASSNAMAGLAIAPMAGMRHNGSGIPRTSHRPPAEGPVQIERGRNQAQMCERLGEIPQRLATRAGLLGV